MRRLTFHHMARSWVPAPRSNGTTSYPVAALFKFSSAGRGGIHFVVVGVDPLPRQRVAAHPGHVAVQRQLKHVAAVRRRAMQADVVEAQRRGHPACVVADDFVLGKIHHQLHPHVLLNPSRVGVAVGVDPQLQPMRNDGLIQGQILAQRHLPKHPIRIGRRRATQHVGVRGHRPRSGNRRPIGKVVVQCDLGDARDGRACQRHAHQSFSEDLHLPKVRAQGANCPCATSRTNRVTPSKNTASSSQSAR